MAFHGPPESGWKHPKTPENTKENTHENTPTEAIGCILSRSGNSRWGFRFKSVSPRDISVQRTGERVSIMRTLKCDRVASLLVLLAFWLSGALLQAQRDTGTLLGTVLDASGSGVPGAAVTVTNVLTNAKVTVTSDTNGDYIATPLRIGTYRVETEISGFKKTVEDGVVLRVQDRLRIDLHLEVGAVTERVEVTAVETLLQTQTSSLGQVFETKQVADLPLNGRSFIQLITLTAGAFVPQKMNTIWPDAFVAINGNRAHENTYLLDGVNNNTSDNNNPAIIPPPDAIAEFKVSTNSLAAEFGRAAGGAINVVIKSGSNQFHGNLFEFDKAKPDLLLCGLPGHADSTSAHRRGVGAEPG